MRQAVEVARGNPTRPFAALLVDRETDELVASGLNRVDDGPIWHGEMDAIHRAAAQNPDWSRLVLYTTAEPCCMCAGAVLWAGIPRVVFGTSITTLLELGFTQVDVPAEELADRRSPAARCEVLGGVRRDLTDPLFREATRARLESEHRSNCRYCQSVLRSSLEGCAANTLTFERDGKRKLRDRLPHLGSTACDDCGVPPGSFHHEGCSSDICPNCGGRPNDCGCRVVSAGFLPDLAVYEMSNLI